MEFLIGLFITLYVLSSIYEIQRKIKPPKKRGKKRTKNTLIIDATKEMNNVINYLEQHYETFCNYKEILQINEVDRLPMLKWMWKKWEYHISEKSLKKKFSKYNIDLIFRIFLIENGRVHAFYKQQEFTNMWNDSKNKPLVWVYYCDYMQHQYICRIEDIPLVYNYVINNWEEDDDVIPDFFLAPKDMFLEECKYDILYVWGVDSFNGMPPEQLKKYCKKANLAYPFK